jgi:hypothetical protein
MKARGDYEECERLFRRALLLTEERLGCGLFVGMVVDPLTGQAPAASASEAIAASNLASVLKLQVMIPPFLL